MSIIIGDIHGEVSKLKTLISNILIGEKNPELIFIGDYIDKGENAFEALQYLSSLENKFNCTFICGNHEYLWLKLQEGDIETENYLLRYGARRTIESLHVRDIFQAKKKLLDYFGEFFLKLKPYWRDNKHIAVHSGIKPEDYDLPLDSLDISNLIFNRYDFFMQEKYYLNQYKIIFGHTGFYSPYADKYKIGIDTAACFIKNQPLTSYSPDKELFVDSNNNVFHLNAINPYYCPNIVRGIF